MISIVPFVASFLLRKAPFLSNHRLWIRLKDSLLIPSSVAADGNPRTAGEPRAPGATGHATSVVEERTHAWPVTGQTPEPHASARAARAPGGGGGPRIWCCIFFFF